MSLPSRLTRLSLGVVFRLPHHQHTTSRPITNLSSNDVSRRSHRKFGNFEIVQPAKVSKAQNVPSSIRLPSYALSGVVINPPPDAEVKNREQILRTREACFVARHVLNKVGEYVEAGISTEELDKITHSLCLEQNAYPSPLNYRWYPKSVCTSVNNVACHGIPDERKLRDGDIVSVDVSVFFNGFHGDCAETYGVGNVDERGWHLLETARYCLESGIAVCRNGAKISQIGAVIEARAEESNCSVVPYFCGHGIGSYFHGPPDIYHFNHDSDEVMKSGMTFTIEPVISEGGPEIVVLEDGWTAVTTDNSRTAQFEQTILITDDGAEVLTRSPQLF